jgi:hypothetical protein
MNENYTYTELLVQYLDGELDDVQSETVKKSLEENTSVREEFDRLSLAKETIKRYGLKSNIGSIHREMMEELKDVPLRKTGVARIIQYTVRIAAIFILVIGVSTLYQYFTASPEKLFKENFRPFTLHETRGNTPSALEDAYKKENMSEVMRLFNTLKDPQPVDYFLTGNAFLGASQPAKAIQAFLSLQQMNKTNSTHYFEEDVEYFLALSYLANNEPAKAIPLFEKIHADANHPYYGKVGNWFLRKLHRLS